MSVPKPVPVRRRRRLHDEGEDVGAENPAVVTRSSECESEDEGPPTRENSECGSAVSDSADQEDETEEGSETETEEGSETEESGSETEEYTDEEGLNEERQSGDGEEQPDNDKPDDDEDKKNPAYVPRKGAFYEHDYRRGGEGPEAEVTEEIKPKKKLWQDEGKWSHDKYIDDMQAPKSRQELIEIYGYDIRIADRPPEAPPRSLRRPKGPKQHNFKDFIPRMAVIDTTEGGHDSVPNLGDDDFIQYRHPGSRNTHRNKGPGTDSRRGGRGGSGRRNYHSDDIEAKNDRNRLVSTRGGHGNHTSVGVSEKSQSVEYPSLGESTKQGVYRDSWRKEDTIDNIGDNSKTDTEGTRKLYPNDADGVGYRNGNQDRFQQSQDIRRLDDSRVKNRSQHGFREERRDNFSHGRRRDGNFSNQPQEENWRSAQNDFRDGPSRANDFRGGRGGYNDFGNGRRKLQQQQPGITGGNTGPGVGNSGDSGYYGNNKLVGKGFEQTPYHQQQAEMPGIASKDAKEYTNSSYKNPEVKSKTVPNFPAASIAGSTASDNSLPATSNSVVISNKENVQTINVTITSTTTEKKSYAKERRAKGVSRTVDGAVLLGGGGAEPPAVPVAPVSSSHFQNMSPAGVHHMDLTSPPLSASANHYSSLRQQGIFVEPPPVSGAKLYNPALPPPSFYQREHSGLPPGQHPTHTPAVAVQDPAHFTPALLPPAAALPYGLPASNAGLALPPNAAGIPPNPALFQPPSGPPAASSIAPATAVIAAPFLPTGMIYAGAARVPPPGAPAGFPLTLAYTTPPPQGAVTAAVVGNQPPPQAAAPGQHKKVYRGDITYYAPELQQPARTTQKRPKAAIPIINPQEVPGQRMKIKSEEMSSPEKSAGFESKNVPSSSSGRVENPRVDTSTSVGSTLATKAAVGGQDVKVLPSSDRQLLARSNTALSQGVLVPKIMSSATLQRAPTASPLSNTDIATAQAKFAPSVNHTDNMKALSSLDGSESKKLAMKIELSPGGPPVNSSTSNSASLGKHGDQSLCTAMQNFKMEDSSGRVEMSASASGNSALRQECEKSVTSINESSIP